ncbi:MAG: hypothetical protein QOH46_4107 [Solirubrobacteraceae bacterium]|nr:hypothetical protein [Solirubrobacteraceae bacterium]
MSSPETPPGADRGSALSGVQRAGIVLGAIAILLIAFVVIRGGDDSGSGSSASNTTPQSATTTDGASSTATATTDDSTTATTDDSATGTTDDSATGTTDGSGSGTGTTDDSGGGTTTDGSGSETGSTPAAPAQPAVRTIRVVNGQPQGGVKTLSYKKGDPIRFKVRSDVADEIHVHGYDLKKDVTAGGTVEFSFTASIEGRFEVELEHAGTQIAVVEVTPS